MTPGSKKLVAVRVREDVWRGVTTEASRRALTIQEAVGQALATWLADVRRIPAPDTPVDFDG